MAQNIFSLTAKNSGFIKYSLNNLYEIKINLSSHS